MSEKRKTLRVPSGRLERLARIGLLVGEAALGGVTETLKRQLSLSEGEDSPLLTGLNAERFSRRLSSLRGAAMKLGQLISMEAEDFLPDEVSRALSTLRADAVSMPETQLSRVLGQSWGKGWGDRLQNFDWDPIAAASIGQVHIGVLSGRTCAFKVQYPGIARSIKSDVDNLASALRLSRILPKEIDLVAIIEEAKRQLKRESDYREEAQALQTYRSLSSDEPDCLVPEVILPWSTRTVLAMEFINGFPIEELCSPDYSPSERDRIASLLYRVLFREIFEWRYCQTDPNFANYLYDPKTRKLGLVDFGSVRNISSDLCEMYRNIFRAGVLGERKKLRTLAYEAGFVSVEESSERVSGVVDLMELGCEPFRSKSYDFGTADLARRLRDRGFDLAFNKGFNRPPPAETMFIHRKIGGTLLLASRLKASVSGRDLIEPFLA